jgi:hypothetical protein
VRERFLGSVVTCADNVLTARLQDGFVPRILCLFIGLYGSQGCVLGVAGVSEHESEYFEVKCWGLCVVRWERFFFFFFFFFF